MKIKFEDKHIIVCFKPAGIISQSTEGTDMISVLNKHFEQNCEEAQAYPVHRLDKETAGLMVYAKNSKAAANLSKQAEQNKIKKHYYAVLNGVPSEKSGVLTDLLFRDKQKNKTYVVNRMRKGVRNASLEYTVADEKSGISLVDILLHTGRTHQIRVQFASRKMPLYGDGRYGGGSGKLALFAHTLEFEHPVSGEKMIFSEKPDTTEYPWSEFEF
ncbi:MAG: RluA family pseudouridine synthase [Ruminococcaceae bacterium]|nr:RluA family pseudouridine synthase [Oscillospiraceae bacterium]